MSECVRCGEAFDRYGRCPNRLCEFHDHEQTCPWGWYGDAEQEHLIEEARQSTLGDACCCEPHIELAGGPPDTPEQRLWEPDPDDLLPPGNWRPRGTDMEGRMPY